MLNKNVEQVSSLQRWMTLSIYIIVKLYFSEITFVQLGAVKEQRFTLLRLP